LIQWQFFPKSDAPPTLAREVVRAFESAAADIDSETHELASNAVLRRVSGGLAAIGFKVEAGKTRDQKICVPVLFGRNGRVEKSFEADAYHADEGFVVEVEAGRGVVNNQVLKDFFQACMMNDVRYVSIAVRNVYSGNKDYERVITFFDTLYASRRLTLPLKGILIIGY
jgi:hypothetical protein